MRAVLLIISLCLVGTSAIAQSEDIAISRFDVLTAENFDVTRLAQQTQVEFAAAGKNWHLALTVNTRLTRQLPPSNTTTLYRGALQGLPDSWVRVSERDGVFQGVIYDGNDYFSLEKNRFGNLRFFAMRDAVIPPGSLACGVEGPAFDYSNTLQSQAEAVSVEIERAAMAAPTQSIDVIMVGDSFFQTENGPDADGALRDRINVVDGYFSDQVGVTLNVTEFRLTDAGTEPFTTDDAGDLLDEVADYKNSEQVTRDAGLLHLYTGRNLDGTTAGIAFRGALCLDRFGSGLSEGRRGISLDTLIAAHEFGHNFGAVHDGDPDEICAAEPGNQFIMAPSVSESIQRVFSDCSLNEMQKDIAVASCLTAIEPIDVLPVLRNFPVSRNIGETFNGTIDVTNNGNAEASNISLVLTVPAGIQLDQTTLPANCSADGTGAACTIASITANNSQSLLFGFTALATGDADIVATTTTPDDDNTGNDSATATVIVTAVVDLEPTIASDAEFIIGESETVTIGIMNNSADASGTAQVQLNASTFLQVESAPGNCVIAGSVVTCQETSVAGNSTATFNITVSGAQTGSTILRATVSSAQTDPNTGNDEITQSINVANPPPSDVDLTISLGGSAGLETDDVSAYTIDVTNAGTTQANAVTLALTFPTTLRADTVNNSDCTIVTGGLDCNFGNMPAAAAIQISMDVRALNAGSGNIEASLATASTDVDSSNNSASLAVSVSDPAPPTPPPTTSSGGGGGGGSTGGLALVLLAALASLRRRNRAFA